MAETLLSILDERFSRLDKCSPSDSACTGIDSGMTDNVEDDAVSEVVREGMLGTVLSEMSESDPGIVGMSNPSPSGLGRSDGNEGELDRLYRLEVLSSGGMR